MSKLLSSLLTSLLSVIVVHASAATVVENPTPNLLPLHHKEYTITAAPGELVYLPIPRQNFPVRVEVSVPNFIANATTAGSSEGYGPYAGSFSVVDIGSGIALNVVPPIGSGSINAFTNPPNRYPGGQFFFGNYFTQLCPGFAESTGFNTVYFLGSNGGVMPPGQTAMCGSSVPAFVYGVAPRVTGTPNRLIFGLIDAFDSVGNTLFGTITFYVSMWY